MLGIDFVNVFVYQNDADNFTAQLLRLYAKADSGNRMRLACAFPAAAELFNWWESQPTVPTKEAIMEKAKQIELDK